MPIIIPYIFYFAIAFYIFLKNNDFYVSRETKGDGQKDCPDRRPIQ